MEREEAGKTEAEMVNGLDHDRGCGEGEKHQEKKFSLAFQRE